jgi:hypothetical protein
MVGFTTLETKTRRSNTFKRESSIWGCTERALIKKRKSLVSDLEEVFKS